MMLSKQAKVLTKTQQTLVLNHLAGSMMPERNRLMFMLLFRDVGFRHDRTRVSPPCGYEVIAARASSAPLLSR